MGWIERIKNYGYQRTIDKSNLPKIQRSIINFDSAKTIGIVFDLSFPGNESVIMKIAEDLRSAGKTVALLAFINNKKALPKNGIKIITPNDVNWFGVPNENAISLFCNEPFDVLLCPFAQQNRPLNYVAEMSKAHCRVGVYSLNEKNNYELMVQQSGETSLVKTTEQMLRLLQQINTENDSI